MNDYKLMTVSELAEMLRVSKPRAYALVRKHSKMRVHIGRQVRVDPVHLRALIEEGML
jgi:excisionase family DNA binding protein